MKLIIMNIPEFVLVTLVVSRLDASLVEEVVTRVASSFGVIPSPCVNTF